MSETEDRVLTRSQWLIRKAIDSGAGPFEALEAVSSITIEHPEWDMTETKTWKEWETR